MREPSLRLAVPRCRVSACRLELGLARVPPQKLPLGRSAEEPGLRLAVQLRTPMSHELGLALQHELRLAGPLRTPVVQELVLARVQHEAMLDDVVGELLDDVVESLVTL